MNDGEAIRYAKQALAGRLIGWRIPDAYFKAAEFIDDMLRQGWRPHPNGLRQPPTKADECRKHAGEWATHCRSCAAEVKGGPGYCEDDDTPTAGGWDAARVREQLRRTATTEETK